MYAALISSPNSNLFFKKKKKKFKLVLQILSLDFDVSNFNFYQLYVKIIFFNNLYILILDLSISETIIKLN